MSKPKLALIPSGYKSGKVYSILPNDATGDFDFDRASEGTRVRKDGLIEEVANDVPRLDWLNSNCPSLLLEPQRSNILQRSEQFDNSYWSKQGGCTVSSNTNLAPNGTLTADTLSGATGTSVSGTVLRRNVVISGNSTLSIYVKSLGSTNFTIYIRNGSNGQVFSQSITPNSDWQRVTLTTNPSNGQVFFGNTNGDVAIWGAMLELGSYPTSYIKTEASTVTRLKDFISGGGNANLFNSLEGTFFVQMASFLNAQTNSNGIELSDSSGQNRVTIQYDTTNNQIRAEIKLANVTQALLFTTFYDVTNFNKIAVTYKYNEAKLYINGSLISTDTSVNIFAEDTLTEVRSTIAGISSGAFNLQAKIKDLRVYDRVLTEAEAIELTTL